MINIYLLFIYSANNSILFDNFSFNNRWVEINHPINIQRKEI